MLNNAIVFLLETFLGLFALALLLRFYLQALRAPARNPLSTFLGALTDWIVVPARRVIPGLWGMDLSTLVLAWATEVVLLVAKFSLGGPETGGAVGAAMIALLLLGAVEVIKLSVYILLVAVILQVVLSWVAPYSPAMPMLNSLTRPFLGPLQRRIPPVGNVDLSPIFLLVGCQLLLFLVAWVETALMRGMAS
jgi:YggT family protein